MTPPSKNHSKKNQEIEPLIFEADEALLAETRAIGQDALRVISKLQRSGHEAYLVGGCVRDLLIGRAPKDFDVATSAHPRQVKRLFRNGRIIGRRFKLVHVRFGSEIIETATFRREPPETNGEDGDLLIVEDNEYGTAAEDAKRRDFTVNGLFLDPFGGEILDYVGGLDDLDDRVLRTIGDPLRRMPEDPVRILRAIKFSTRLDFRIEDNTWEAMRACSVDLQRSAPPRILEEVLRLLRSGTALGAFKKLRSCGALGPILPGLDKYLSSVEDDSARTQSFYSLLEALDADIHSGAQLSSAVLVATMVHDLVAARLPAQDPGGPSPAVRDVARAADAILDPFTMSSRLPKRDAAKARRLLTLQGRFTNTANERTRPLLFCLMEDFEEALALFRIRTRALGRGWDIYEGWVDRARQAESLSEEELSSERKRGRKRRRRRTKRR
jgi:poly(A) polymerase